MKFAKSIKFFAFSPNGSIIFIDSSIKSLDFFFAFSIPSSETKVSFPCL